MNVTTIGSTRAGSLNLWRSDIALPDTSVINFNTALNRANNAILSLSRDGQGSIAVKPYVAGDGTVHLVIDVNGYFE